MKGKDKCKILKELRSEIAANNDIEYVVSECKHQGECKGTCPKCEAEVAYLERELEKRRSLGKKVVLAGIGVGVAATMAGCTNPVQSYVIDPVVSFFSGNNGGGDIAGDEQYIPPEELGGAAEPLSEDVEVLDGEIEEIPKLSSEEIIELDGDVEYIPEEEEDCSEEECIPEEETKTSEK